MYTQTGCTNFREFNLHCYKHTQVIITTFLRAVKMPVLLLCLHGHSLCIIKTCKAFVSTSQTWTGRCTTGVSTRQLLVLEDIVHEL